MNYLFDMNLKAKITTMKPSEWMDITNHRYRLQIIDIVNKLICLGECYKIYPSQNRIKYLGYFSGDEFITK